MGLPCIAPGCEGDVATGWDLHTEISACDTCGKEHRVFGDETYDSESGDCFEWWWVVEPNEENPW